MNDLFEHELRDALTPDVPTVNALLERAGIDAEAIDICTEDSP